MIIFLEKNLLKKKINNFFATLLIKLKLRNIFKEQPARKKKSHGIPSLTTFKLVTASGTLTPAATNVNPITVLGIFKKSPTRNKENY